MVLLRILILSPLILLQLPIHSLATSAVKQSRLRRTAASMWRQAITGHNGYSSEEEFMTVCQTEMGLVAEDDVVSHDDYAAFLAQYCQSNPGWACSYDTSYFWRLDPRLQRVFISERCPGEAFHQEECLEYFVEHPEQDLGYSGEIEKLCSSVKELLVPTGLVWEMTASITASRNGGSGVESGVRSQELEQSQDRAVDEYLGKNRGSKRSGKRGKNNGDYFSKVDDEEDGDRVDDKEKKGRDGSGKEEGGGENHGVLIVGEQSEEDEEVHQILGNSTTNVTEESNGIITTGDQDVLTSVDGPGEMSPPVETSSNITVPSAGLNEENSNEPKADQQSEPNEESKDAHMGMSQNGRPPSEPPSNAEENLGSKEYDENIATNERDKDKVRNLVLAITGSFAFVLILGIARGSRTRLHQRNKEAPVRHYECFVEEEELSLPSGESDIFQSSDGSTLEAALSFINSRTKKEEAPTTQQRAYIASFFSRLIHLVHRDATRNAASDFDSVHARCEDLSFEAINGESSIFNSLTLAEKVVADEKGWRKRLEIGGFSHDHKRNMFDVGKGVDRILRQIEESPCESEISAEESSISVYTESSCDNEVIEEPRERTKDFDSRTTGLVELTAQMSTSRNQSLFIANGSASNDASTFRSLRDCFETRAGNEFNYRGGAGSSGPDSSTTSDVESTCSSTTESMQADSTE
jgi:hypothetical protein